MAACLPLISTAFSPPITRTYYLPIFIFNALFSIFSYPSNFTAHELRAMSMEELKEFKDKAAHLQYTHPL